ncbi:hypothetical protein F5H01DRAFT_326536 [Linnemannia elongata]|nr:hypothetical protein F5H01DRAFT_326536 [Linnemannia elongata]
MSLPLPEAACTPEAYRPRLDMPNPFVKDKSLKLDPFFYEEDAKRWLSEVYAASHGGNTSGYLEGLRVMLTRRHSVTIYCESDRGKEQLELLESFSTFEVVSSHLVVNAGIRLGSQLKYNMHSSTSHSANVGTVDRDYQVDDTYESSPRKRTRNEGDDYRDAALVGTPDRSFAYDKDVQELGQSSYPSSPEESTLSPPPPPPPPPLDFGRNVNEMADTFFSGEGSLQDILFGSLQDGGTLPAWAKDRPLYQFELRLQDEDWGHRVTNLYEAAKMRAELNHSNVDEIALLSGIVHLNKTHIGFSEQEIKAITADVVDLFYSQDMRDSDLQRAKEATHLWTSWVQKLKGLLMDEKALAIKERRDAVEAVDTKPVMKAIMSSYAECDEKQILPAFFFALHVFRQYNYWGHLLSESDCLMSAVGPILNEFMAVQHEIKFTSANACTRVGKARKMHLQQSGQSRQPDVIGLTASNKEVFYGELKGPTPKAAAINTDVLRIAVFSKDSLDQARKVLAQGLLLLTFQTLGRNVTCFLTAKISNTIVHTRLSSSPAIPHDIVTP